MYGEAAIVYVSAAVFFACTIAGNCEVAVKQQGFACNLCSPNELQSNGTASFMPRRDGRDVDALLRHGPCTHGSGPK